MLYYDLAKGADLPVLVIIKEIKGGFLYGVYTGVLLAAVLTTAAGNFFGFLERLFREKNRKYFKAAVLTGEYITSLAGFSGIISIIYPIFGILGLLNILFIVYNMYKSSFKNSSDIHKREIWTKKKTMK
ncbi:MAG: hypothetical protein LUD77_00200 [Clostridiales bacterium]|nr:hypothetical protein [Clostridiales bacterium]